MPEDKFCYKFKPDGLTVLIKTNLLGQKLSFTNHIYQKETQNQLHTLQKRCSFCQSAMSTETDGKITPTPCTNSTSQDGPQQKQAILRYHQQKRSTWVTEGRFSFPFLANVSSPFSEENKPFLFRTLCDRDKVRFLRAASSLEQIYLNKETSLPVSFS